MSARLRAVAGGKGTPAQPGTAELLGEALVNLALAERCHRHAAATVEHLRRRYRDETPGMFLLPSLDQLRRELLP